MTALMILENVPPEDFEKTLLTAPSYYNDPILGNGGADILPNEQLTAKSVLFAIMISSANEAAHVAALNISNGNLESFYYMMNSRAKQLGCENTSFVNEHGIINDNKNNSSTAYNTYLILKECLKYEVLTKLLNLQHIICLQPTNT